MHTQKGLASSSTLSVLFHPIYEFCVPDIGLKGSEIFHSKKKLFFSFPVHLWGKTDEGIEFTIAERTVKSLFAIFQEDV